MESACQERATGESKEGQGALVPFAQRKGEVSPPRPVLIERAAVRSPPPHLPPRTTAAAPPPTPRSRWNKTPSPSLADGESLS